MAAVDPKKLKALVKRDSKAPFAKGGKVKAHVEEDDDEDLEEDEDEANPGPDDEEDEEDEDDEDSEVDVDAIGQRVQDGKGDKRLMKLSKGITDETNPPASITDEGIWEKAKAAVEPKWDDYDEPYAVVMHVYEKMGGGFK